MPLLSFSGGQIPFKPDGYGIKKAHIVIGKGWSVYIYALLCFWLEQIASDICKELHQIEIQVSLRLDSNIKSYDQGKEGHLC